MTSSSGVKVSTAPPESMTFSKEAVVDGHHSVQCYLDALSGAYEAWVEACGEAGFETIDIARRLYHVPYGKMAKKAHRQLMQTAGKGEAEADASYAAEVAPSLVLPGKVGNVYTGSMIKDGTLLGAGSWVSNPAGATLVDQLTFLTYQVRLNQAARDSLKAAVKI